MLKPALAVLSSLLVGAAAVPIASAYGILTKPLEASVAVPDRSIDGAVMMCATINATRYKPNCMVSHRPRYINFTLDISRTEAATVCAETAAQAAQTGLFTGNVWTIQIFHTKVTEPVHCPIIGKKPQ